VVEMRDTGVEANGRLTAMTGIALFVLLAAEGMTILRIDRLLPEHFFTSSCTRGELVSRVF
jgi:hypothetical protein